jgi:hypothetical protein
LQQLKTPTPYDPDTAETLARTGNLYPFMAFGLGLNVDAQFQGTSSLPPAVIVDYMYGIAAYKLWKSQPDRDVHGVMESYHEQRYKGIPPRDDASKSDNQDDLDYVPDVAEAMDDLSLRGVTPEEAAIRRELEEQEASQGKVMEWMKTTDVGGL